MLCLTPVGCGKEFPKMRIESCWIWAYHLDIKDVKNERISTGKGLKKQQGIVTGQ
jgi:hypothetical protein